MIIAPDVANLLPPLPPNVYIATVAVVAVVDDVLFVLIIFGEDGAPLEVIEVIPHLVLVPVGP